MCVCVCVCLRVILHLCMRAFHGVQDSDCVPILQDVSERRRPEESSICVLPIMKTFAEHLKAFSEASLHESDVIITQLASLVKDYVLEVKLLTSLCLFTSHV